MNEKDILDLVKNDAWMMGVLHKAEELNLPDWMVGAGFLRNKVWDNLHGIKREGVDIGDIDLVYFDASKIDKGSDEALSTKMKGVLGFEWEIRNQAYMHTKHKRTEPYRNSEEVLAEWIETPTCVAVTIKNGELKLIAPHGIGDLVNLLIRPTPYGKRDMPLFWERVNSKKWLEKWPKLRVESIF